MSAFRVAGCGSDRKQGFPDSFNGRDGFWLALYAPRDSFLDRILPHPALLEAVYRIRQFLRPKPRKVAHVLKLDLDGKVQGDLLDSQANAYAPITSVREYKGMLFFGSNEYPAIGRMPLPGF